MTTDILRFLLADFSLDMRLLVDLGALRLSLLSSAFILLPTRAMLVRKNFEAHRLPERGLPTNLLRRDETICAAGLYLCDNGGCCPNGRACGVTDCPVSSQAPATAACTQTGYTVCAVEDGGR